MRQIGTLSDPQQARAFADYLLTQGVTSKLDESPAGVVVWIREEDHLSEARAALAEFQANPLDEKYQVAAREADQVRRESQARETQFRRNLIDMRRRWSPAGTAARRPLTVAIILAAATITLMSNFG